MNATKSDLELCDHDMIRRLLDLPVYLPGDAASSWHSPDSLKARPPLHASAPTPKHPSQILPLDAAAIAKEVSPDYSFLEDASIVEEVNSSEVISADGLHKGRGIKDLVFLDQTVEARRLYRDCSYSHTFKVRGPHYLVDKKKVEAGPAAMKLMFMELFKVDCALYGDRIDHISAIGTARRRVETLVGLEEKPFVFVFNLQLPGDPPISIVSYFVLPPQLRERGGEHLLPSFLPSFFTSL